MNRKIILSLLAKIGFKFSDQKDNGLPEIVSIYKDQIIKEFNGVLLRFFSGLIISIGIIYCSIEVGENAKIFLSQFDNQVVLRIVTFMVIGILLIFSLLVILKGKSIFQKNKLENLQNESQGIKIEFIISQFVEGYIQGLLIKKGKIKNEVNLKDSMNTESKNELKFNYKNNL